jgi:hypothetical protein
MSLILDGSNGVSDIDGSAATPAIRGTDANTGIFFPAADTIAFSEGGAEVARFDASGNLGIGTSAPATILNAYNATSAIISVDGDSQTQFRTSRYSTDSTATQINLRKSRGTLASPTTVASSDSVGIISYQAYDGTTFRGVASVTAGVESYTGTDNLAGALIFATRPSGSAAVNTERGRFDSSGNFQFNSGYGSVAAAYGCRAWVNFNGTGTPAIRASGNVSSITDNGTGDYTVNFTNAMPDVNYAIAGATNEGTPFDNAAPARILQIRRTAPTTTTSRFAVTNFGNTNTDVEYVYVQIFR